MNIKELAKKLNLSITTVSRGLADYSDVSLKTKEKIKKLAKKYNYSPNAYASNLASRNKNIVGFVMPLYGLNYQVLNQTSFFQFISGMQEKLKERKIHFIMEMCNSEEEELLAYQKLIFEQKVNNIIIHNLKINDPRINILKKNKINFVAWGRTQKLKNYSWVDLDNHLSMKMIVEYLFSFNHKKIAFVNVNEEFNFAYQRKEAFSDSIKINNIKLSNNNYLTVSQNNPELSFDKIKKFLKKNRDVTALICCTEYIAAGAIKACYELDFKIGKNFSLITYDSLIISHLTQPSLTSASHPVNELGSQAIEILLQKRVNNKNNSYLAVPEIINRGSVHLVEN